jgi:hypothetical protein
MKYAIPKLVSAVRIRFSPMTVGDSGQLFAYNEQEFTGEWPLRNNHE